MDRELKILGEQRYAFHVPKAGIIFELDRLRRSSHELWGELLVRVNGKFPLAKTFDDGILQAGDLNLSSVQARATRARLIGERAGDANSVDWYGLLEEFTQRVITAEREGEPSIGMTEVPLATPGQEETWNIQGVPLLVDLPFVLFGDAAAAKSYMALWLSGTMAQRGVPVLYLDWEFSGAEHRKRLERLFTPPPSQAVMRYKRCERPLIRMIDGILSDIRRWNIGYVVCDSIGFALEGSPLDAEAATRYFAAVRRFNCGSLHLAHIAKSQEDGKDPTIFGSAYFKAGARSAWYIERTMDNPEDEIRVGMYHRKLNGGKQHDKPLGYKLTFSSHRTLVEPISLETVDELAANLPLLQRLRKALADGPLTCKRLAEDLATSQNTVRAVIAKHKSSFTRVGNTIALATPGEMF